MESLVYRWECGMESGRLLDLESALKGLRLVGDLPLLRSLSGLDGLLLFVGGGDICVQDVGLGVWDSLRDWRAGRLVISSVVERSGLDYSLDWVYSVRDYWGGEQFSFRSTGCIYPLRLHFRDACPSTLERVGDSLCLLSGYTVCRVRDAGVRRALGKELRSLRRELFGRRSNPMVFRSPLNFSVYIPRFASIVESSLESGLEGGGGML